MPLNTNFFPAITSTLGVCLLLLAEMSPPYRTAQVSRDERGWHAIDGYVTRKMQAPHLPGVALVIVKGDQIVYVKGYSQSDSSEHPVTLQTPFLIGSISKSFTARAVIQLVEEGLVALDALIQQYIPWFRAAIKRTRHTSLCANCSTKPA